MLLRSRNNPHGMEIGTGAHTMTVAQPLALILWTRNAMIDAIAQSWAVLSGAGDPQHSRRAMQSVLERLVVHRSVIPVVYALIR